MSFNYAFYVKSRNVVVLSTYPRLPRRLEVRCRFNLSSDNTRVRIDDEAENAVAIVKSLPNGEYELTHYEVRSSPVISALMSLSERHLKEGTKFAKVEYQSTVPDSRSVCYARQTHTTEFTSEGLAINLWDPKTDRLLHTRLISWYDLDHPTEEEEL